MSSELTPPTGGTSTLDAVRHRLGWVIAWILLGALAGWAYSSSSPTTYTSTARVLVNPTAGNPFVPTPSSVRTDELTSLETEAQVMRSEEVLDAVVAQHPEWSATQIQRGLSVVVPPNTQVLAVTYTGKDPATAQGVAQAVADTYLTNRAQRFKEVNDSRIARVEARTNTVVDDLRTATEASQTGKDAEKLFQSELAEALRNELVSLRAQRTALENTEGPAGSVIAPASKAVSAAGITALVMPIGGGVAGLALGCLIAVLLERFRGKIRSARDVERRGLSVIAAVPHLRALSRIKARLRPASVEDGVATTVRRLRATILDVEPRPGIITIASAGTGSGDAGTAEAVAQSFAKAGHGVVLVRADPTGRSDDLEEREGLAQVLTYDRLKVARLLRPTADPLLSVLPDGGFTEQSRELLVGDRLRGVLSQLTDTGHLVVVQSAGVDTPDGEAAVAASDLSIVVLTRGRTRPQAVDHVVRLMRRTGAPLVGLLVEQRSFIRRGVRPDAVGPAADLSQDRKVREAPTEASR